MIKARWVLSAYAALFLLIVLPVAVWMRGAEASYDEGRCYLPAITQLRASFPAVDLVKDSLSASPPGYSQLLAALSFATGDSLAAHRAWHAGLSLAGALALIAGVARLSGDSRLAAVALLPAVCSGYYFKGAAQLSTDNPAMVLSFGALAVALLSTNKPRHALVGFLLGAASVYVRHITVWVAVPFALKGWQASQAKTCKQAVLWLSAAGGIGLFVIIFICAWGGLVPPIWSKAHGDISLMPVVYSFSIAGLFGGFYLLAAGTWHWDSVDWLAIAAGGFTGAVAFFLSASDPSYDAGRWGGSLWAVAAKVPLWGGRSYLFLPLSIAGGALLFFAGYRLHRKAPQPALLWIFSLAAWLSTGAVNHQVFQRYYEGPVLAFWGLWLLVMFSHREASWERVRGWVLYALSALLLITGGYSLWTSVTGFEKSLVGVHEAIRNKPQNHEFADCYEPGCPMTAIGG